MRQMKVTTVLTVLTEHPGISFSELAERCGLPSKAVEAALHHLIRTNHVKSEPVRYSVTAEGVVGLGDRLALQARSNAKAERRAASRARREKKQAELAPKNVKTVVRAIAARHPLEAAWGGMHA